MALGISVTVAASAAAQVSPEKSLATLKVSEGLEISLWASEPLCVNPTSMDIDHKGRVWLCESINYRCKLRGTPLHRPEGDRIVVLEDTDNDGKADASFTFYQAPDILAPLGIAVAPYPDGKGQKVYVCHSPHIYLFDDKDGDLKADGPPKILLTGFKGYDHDHGVHGILIGPDNRLYFSVGDQGVKDLQSSDGKGRKWTSNNTDCRAGTIWRCDLDGKNLELIAHNFRNNYEPCVDSFGNIFVSDNDDDGSDQSRICFVMPGGNYGYHPRGKGQSHWHEEQPGIVPKILRTFRGSPCGMCFYEGTLLPKKYWGQPLHVDAGPGRLSCYHLKPKGAGFDALREDMVTSTDSWFRPSDVCIAPDGSVFVADWYDPGVGGHGIGDFTRGRIYRVAPLGNKPQVPEVKLNTWTDNFYALATPNLAARAMAMAKWQWDRAPMPEGGTKPLALLEGKLMARHIWQSWYEHRTKFENKGIPLQTRTPLAVLIPQLWFLPRVLKDTGSLSFSADALESFAKDAEKATVASWRELLLAMVGQDPMTIKPYFYLLARKYDGKDRFYLAALGIAVGHPGISPEIDKRREIILADFAKHFPEWNEKVAGLVWELRPPGMVAMLSQNLSDPKVPANQRALIVDILAGAPDVEVADVFLKSLESNLPTEIRDGLLYHLRDKLADEWAHVRKKLALREITGKLLEKKDSQLVGVALVGAAQQKEFLSDLGSLALQAQQQPVRLAAVQALGEFKLPEATQFLGLVIQQRKFDVGAEVRAEAVLALGKQGTPKAREFLQSLIVQTTEVSSPLRQAAAAGLAASKDGSLFLLDTHKEKKLGGDLVADLSRLLRNSPFPEIRKQAVRVFPPPPKLDPKNLPSISALLAKRGSSERGREVLLATLKNEAQCLKCHTVHGVGGNVGPDLSTIGSKASRENLLESILYPSRAVTDQYKQWTVETKKGLVINGLLIEEAPDHVLLRDANAKDHKVDKKDIALRNPSPVSIMPDNFLLYLPEQDLVDLVEYLFSLKNTPVPTSRNELPFSREPTASAGATLAVGSRLNFVLRDRRAFFELIGLLPQMPARFEARFHEVST